MRYLLSSSCQGHPCCCTLSRLTAENVREYAFIRACPLARQNIQNIIMNNCRQCGQSKILFIIEVLTQLKLNYRVLNDMPRTIK